MEPPSTPAASAAPKPAQVRLRHPELGDGAAMWEFVSAHDGLERNTAYAYLVLADDFRATCILAEDGEELAGFVLGYHPPARPDALFVWQVGVAPSHRGQGLAGRMIDQLIASTGAAALESTVTPDNDASRRLFRSIAERHGAECDIRTYLTADHFPEPDHEAEERFFIGPLKQGN